MKVMSVQAKCFDLEQKLILTYRYTYIYFDGMIFQTPKKFFVRKSQQVFDVDVNLHVKIRGINHQSLRFFRNF